MPDTETLDEDKRCTLFDKPKRFCLRCSEFHAADDWMDTCERYVGAAPIRQCKTCGGWHPLDAWRGNCLPEPNWNRSELSSPQIINDNLYDAISPINGKPLSSKRAWEKECRARGLVQVGNEQLKTHVSERKIRPEKSDREIEAAADIRQLLQWGNGQDAPPRECAGGNRLFGRPV
jgi:hypothetical protein